MKAQTTFFKKVLPKKLEEFFSVALMKIRKICTREITHSGIRFYVEADE